MYFTAAKDAAYLAGDILKKYWGKLSHIEEKSISGDLVTEADKAAEKIILETLTKHFPDHQFLSEESGSSGSKSSFLWVIDPLDGTTNYTHQYPFVSVSIALFHHQEPLLGIVYNPILHEFFFAEKNQGAYFNDVRIHVSKTAELKKSLFATGFAYDRRENSDNNYKEFCWITHQCHGVRRAGSAALDLAYVAAGKLDGFWERGLKPWDMAAGKLLCEEARGLVTAYDGSPFDLYSGRILATNGLVHDALIQELKKAKSYQFN